MKILNIFPKVLFIFLLLLFANYSFSNKYNLEKIEPPFWWVGMQNPNLQLLVYGKNISETQPQINYKGVILKEVIKAENPNYLFLNLEITDDAIAGFFRINFIKENKIVQTYRYELKNRKAGSKERKGFNSSDVIYLMMPDRFSNGDTSNDNIQEMKEKADRSNPNGRHGGDLQGIKNKLDYLADLGITAIWINPVFENNMPVYSYHGYAITDFYKIDPRFGTNNDYVELIEDSHKKGIKIIMDMIFNHCGSGHWWMNDLPSQDWLNQWDKFTRTNYRAGVTTDPYASDYDNTKLLAGWFDITMPDMNQKNELLANYLIQNSIWWIEYAGLDGIRMDTYPYSYKDFMSDWMKRILQEYPDFNVVGESWLSVASSVAYWQENTKNPDGYQSNLTNVFDFPMMYAMGEAFVEKNSWDKGIVKIYDILGQDFVYANPNKLVIFADNHDGDRFFTKVNENLDDFKLAMAFLLTTRGIPEIYYGTEILMTGHENRGHGNLRKDFPGGWQGDKTDAFTAEGRTKEQNEAFDYLKKLLIWRKNNKVIHTGKLKHFIPENGVYVYFRYDDNESVMVLLNNSNKEQEIKTDRFAECLKGFNSGKDIISGKEINDLNIIKIPAKTAKIIELEK